MDEDIKELSRFVGVVAGITCVFFYVMFAAGNHIKFDAEYAAFEQLRSDTHVSRVNAEDILGMAAKANSKLVYKQTWNKKWYADLIIPDGWDFVETIEVAPE